MLNVPEYVKQRCRDDNNRAETVKHLDLAFFESGIDSLYPANDLYPEDSLYPADAGEPWLTIGTDRINVGSMNLTENLCSGNDIILGSCEAAKIEVTVADVEEELTGREFAATLSVGDYKLAYGMYTVASMVRQADRRLRKITAYDRMVLFDADVTDWYNAQYPTDSSVRTVKQLRDSLCAFCGVPQIDVSLINDSLVVGKTIDPQTLKGRDVLKAICEINGVFGHIDRTGQLVYVHLQESGIYPSDTLYPSDGIYPMTGWGQAEDLAYYRSITYEDYVTAGIDRIQIRTEEGDIGATSSAVDGGANTYVIEGNFLTYGLGSSDLTRLAQSICDAVGGREYRPAKLVTYAMPWLEVGDGVRAITTDTEISTYVLQRTMKGIQGMSDTIESKGSQTMKQNTGIATEIIQLKGRTAKLVKTVDEVSATLSDLEKNTTAQLKVVSDAITAEVKRATGQETALSGKISVMAGQIEAKVSRGDLVAAINLEVNKAGSCITMEAGHFVFKGKNFYVNADGSGGAANGNFTWDKSGGLIAKNIKLVMAEISGTANTSTIGCRTLSAQDADIDHLTVNGRCEMRDISTGDIYAEDIECTQIYSSQAEEWWSDRRLKHDIHEITQDEALRVTLGLNPVTFVINGSDSVNMGFVAQDVAALNSELPLYGVMRNGYYCLPYASYVAVLAGAMQAINKRLVRLEDKVDGRENEDAGIQSTGYAASP